MASLILRAGPLSAQYAAGGLRYIRLEGREVLRHVHIALRDERWQTIPARFSRETITPGEDWFRVELAAEHVSSEVDFAWEGIIEGDRDGRILWTMVGEPRRSFRRNRIGFCVLHPIVGCAGKPGVIEHSNGTREVFRFPEEIAPHQPFVDVRAMSHEVRPGIAAEVRFTGDVFETEDHRNWTDYSFKTYSTPLALPRPVTIGPGQRIQQTVELTIRAAHVRIHADRSRNLRMPELDFIRVDVRFAGSQATFDSAFLQANVAKPLEIALFTDDPERDLPPVLPQLLALNICRYLIFSGDGTITTVAAAQSGRRILGSEIPIGGGSNTNFTELNRNREAVDSLDFLSWPINPRVHAEDPETMVENLEGQAATVQSARAFARGKPLRISRVHIPPIPAAEGWTAASMGYLGQAGVASIAWSAPHPLLDELAAFNPESLLPVYSSDPLRAYALVLRSGARVRAWLANFADEPQTIAFENEALGLQPLELRRIDLEGG